MPKKAYREYGEVFEGYRLEKKEENITQMRSRKKRKAGRDIVIASLVLLLMICIAVGVSSSIFFKLSEVKIINKSIYSDEMIAETAALAEGTNLLQINKSELQKKILSTLPYAKSVNIKLKLPTTVEIEVIPDTATLAMTLGGGYILMSDELRALESVLVLPDNVAFVNGPEIEGFKIGEKIKFLDDKTINIAAEIIKCANENEIKGGIKKIDIDDVYNIKLETSEGVKIEIGNRNDLKYKLEFVRETLATIDGNARGTIKIVGNKASFLEDSAK